ncbi:MAG: hypothetical protein IJI45_01455 [Anaerolineaceae bacterium]|nr:hypothetical protein [Anaerolineaceae bacterium]
MASIGLKYMGWSPLETETDYADPTYGDGIVLGKAVSTNLAVTNAEGELYADDQLAEYVSEFASATLTAEVDNIELQNQAKLHGAKYEDGEIQHFDNDNAPYGGIGGYQVLLVHGVKKYRTWFFAKAKASIPNHDGNTKGASISFGTQPINERIIAPAHGPWYRVKEFTNEDAAKAYIDSKLNIAEWHNISVQKQGTGTVSPVGTSAVADGEDFVLSISGTPTKVYDNGQDVTSSVSEGVYTIENMAADHNIAVIYSA